MHRFSLLSLLSGFVVVFVSSHSKVLLQGPLCPESVQQSHGKVQKTNGKHLHNISWKADHIICTVNTDPPTSSTDRKMLRTADRSSLEDLRIWRDGYIVRAEHFKLYFVVFPQSNKGF